jgi:hypothetical protein
MRAARPMLHPSRAALTHGPQPLPRPAPIGELTVRFHQVRRRTSAVEFSKQNRSRGFDDAPRRSPQRVRKPYPGRILAQPNGVSEINVRMILDDEVRWPPFAPQTRVDSLKNPLSTGDQSSAAGRETHGFLRTGGGSVSFSASSISLIASFVPSIASSSVSR